VAEAAGGATRAALDAAAAEVGFTVERSNIEALGLCPACAETEA
jgi:Fur family zinc uptake transcriptional regulator